MRHVIVENRNALFVCEIAAHFKTKTRQGAIAETAIAALFATDFILVQWAVVQRDAQAGANEEMLGHISAELVGPAIGQTQFVIKPAVKGAGAAIKIWRHAEHRFRRADPAPSRPLGRVKLHFPIGVDAAFMAVAERPAIVQQHTENSL